MSKKIVVTAGLIGALGLVAATLLHAQSPEAAKTAAAPRPALTVEVVQPQLQSLARSVSAVGSIAAWQEASIGTETNGWRLAEVRANVGDRVRRGQVLAVFAADLARAELAQAQAALAEHEASLAEAAANAQRARELQGSGALSAQQIQQYVTAERTAQARLEAQRANVKTMQIRLAQTELRAPDDGVISARGATLGAVVAPGQELFRLVRQGRLEWRAEVAAADLAALRPGATVRVQPTGAPPIDGKLRMVSPTVDPQTRNAIVFVDLPAPGAARAGMFARGEFVLGESSALTLPASAVLLRDGHAWVFRVGADGKVQQGKVVVGRRSGDRVEVVSGLDAQARVVASGGGFLTDGDLVRVAAAAAAPKR